MQAADIADGYGYRSDRSCTENKVAVGELDETEKDGEPIFTRLP
jgi:hypothetical protein